MTFKNQGVQSDALWTIVDGLSDVHSRLNGRGATLPAGGDFEAQLAFVANQQATLLSKLTELQRDVTHLRHHGPAVSTAPLSPTKSLVSPPRQQVLPGVVGKRGTESSAAAAAALSHGSSPAGSDASIPYGPRHELPTRICSHGIGPVVSILCSCVKVCTALTSSTGWTTIK
jgi:hypothetical protein